MSRFRDVLRKTNERLDLPQPAKSRILLEIAADLEDMFEFYVSEGMSEQEAERMAGEKFDISDGALAELVEIHESPLRKMLGILSLQAQTRWERVVLGVTILFIAWFSGRQAVSAEVFRDAGRYGWAVAGFTFAALIVTVWHAYRLFIKKDHDIRRLRSGLPWLLMLGSASAVTGLFGSSVGMYRAIGRATADMDRALHHMIGWGISCSALMLLSLCSAIAAGLFWYLLMNKARNIELAEAAWLLEE